MSKKILAALLAVMMVLTLVPMTAMAAGEYAPLPDPVNGKITLTGNVSLTGKTLRFFSVTPGSSYGDDIVITGVNELNLNGFNITGDKTVIKVHNQDLTITGSGTIENTCTAETNGSTTTIWLMDTGNLTVTNATVQNAECDNGHVIAFNDSCNGKAPVLTLNNATISSPGTTKPGNSGSGIYVQGLITNTTTHPKIVVNGGSITAEHGMYLAGYADTNITNATVNASVTGIEIRSGDLKVTDSTINGGTGEPSSASNTTPTSGESSKNAGIAVAQHKSDKPISVSVIGGTVTGGNALLLADPESKQSGSTLDTEIRVGVNGSTLEGKYDNDGKTTAVDASVGTIGVALLNSTITGEVKMKESQGGQDPTNVTFVNTTVNGSEQTTSDVKEAIIGGIMYNSVGDAITAANSGDTITLLKDITHTVSSNGATYDDPKSPILVTGGKNITLDLNGKTVTSNNGRYTVSVKETGSKLTIIDGKGGGKISNTNASSTTINVYPGAALTLGYEGGSNGFTITSSEKTGTDWNSAVKVDENGTLLMYGGTIDAPSYAADGQFKDSIRRSMQIFGSATIYDGTVKNEVQIWSLVDNGEAYTGDLAIHGGTFEDNVVVTGRANDDENYPIAGALTVAGGDFGSDKEVGIREVEGNTATESAKVVVTGGSNVTLLPQAGTVTVTFMNGNTVAAKYQIKKDGTISPFPDGTWYTARTNGSVVNSTASFETDTTLYNTTSSNTSSGGGSSSGTTGSVTVTKPANGTVTSNVTTAKEGDKVTVTVKPDASYYVVTGVTASGDSGTIRATKNADGTYSFTMPKGNVTVNTTIRHIYDLFTDVPTDIAEYGTAIKWAVEKNITLGTDPANYSTFGPYSPCTRAQMVVFLYRAAGSPTVTGTNSFTDLPSDSEIQKAVQWAVSKDITKGTSATTFDPYAPCTRGQMVTFLHRNHSEPAATGTNNFADVPTDAFYKTAVQWAVNSGVTKGTSDTTFDPDSACTRVQMVTFLYRDMGK